MTCQISEILGIFPEIENLSCPEYALILGVAGSISALVFWMQVTK